MQARAPCMLPAVPRLRDSDHGALWQWPDRDTATVGHCCSARPETQRPWGTVAVPGPRHSDRGALWQCLDRGTATMEARWQCVD